MDVCKRQLPKLIDTVEFIVNIEKKSQIQNGECKLWRDNSGHYNTQFFECSNFQWRFHHQKG